MGRQGPRSLRAATAASPPELKLPWWFWSRQWTGEGQGREVLYCTLTVPSGQVSPSRRATCCPCPDMKSFKSQTTPMKCHGKFDKNQEEVKLTLGDGRVK